MRTFAVALALTIASSAGAASMASTPRGTLVCGLTRDGGTSTWLELARLSDVRGRRLTNPVRGRVDEQLTFSPAGRRVAFVRRGAGSGGVYVVGVAGAPRPRRILALAAGQTVGGLAWSLNGARLALDRYDASECTGRRPFNLRLTILRPGGSVRDISLLPRPRVLVELVHFEWSPNGKRIVYIVYVMDVDDDGDCRRAQGALLYTIDENGRNRRLITRTRFSPINEAAWSPDGSRIAYVDCDTANPSGCDLKIVGPTSRPRRLRTGVLPLADITWLRPGKEILVLERTRLSAISASTGRVRTLARWRDELDEIDDPGAILDVSEAGSQIGFFTGWDYERPRNFVTVRVVSRTGRNLATVQAPPAEGVGELAFDVGLSLP